jgi:phosphatidylethanolamine-binding protein (PEBP) family uncharacterized protein
MHSGLRSKTTLALVAALALVTALVLAGCGGSGSGSTSQSSTTSLASATQTSTSSSQTTSTTTTSRSTSSAGEKMPTLTVALTTTVNLNPISAHYTCNGGDATLPVSWSQIPAGTVEIDLFFYNILPIHGKYFDDWAVAGLKPTLRRLSSNQLPPGAIVGRNNFGKTRWTVCPEKGANLHYSFLLYALPKRIPVKPGFEAEKLREEGLHTAKSAGLLTASYTRP